MSDNSNATGSVMPYSDRAFSNGVHVGAEKPSPTPAVSLVEVIEQTKVEGAAFDTFRPGIMGTVRDGRTGDIIGNREVQASDRITITTGSGRQMEVRVAQAEAEGFIHRDASGRYHESDRAAQAQVLQEMQQLEASKRDAEAVK